LTAILERPTDRRRRLLWASTPRVWVSLRDLRADAGLGRQFRQVQRKEVLDLLAANHGLMPKVFQPWYTTPRFISPRARNSSKSFERLARRPLVQLDDEVLADGA